MVLSEYDARIAAAQEAYDRMMSGKARFRVVLKMT